MSDGRGTLVERFVDTSEIDTVMRFFREHWGKDHILGNDRDFMLWQMSPRRSPIFANAGLAALSYWDGLRLAGLIGVMSMPFNCNGEVADSAWLCNLQAAPEYLPLGIGTKLMTGVHKLPIAGIGAAGINLRVIPMYRAMRYHCIDKLPRFIRIVDAARARALIAGKSAEEMLSPRTAARRDSACHVEHATASGDEWDAFWANFTSAGYFGTHRDSNLIRWRYLEHPRLRYQVTLARDSGGRLVGGMVHRLETVKDREEKLLRVVELIAREDAAYAALLIEAERVGADAGVAFIDHYSSQPRADIFRDLGWYEEDDHPGVVTPGLFQPLLRQTRKINLAVRLLGGTAWKAKPWREQLYVVKADGDQDRPS